MIVKKLAQLCSVFVVVFLISAMVSSVGRPANAATDAEIIRGFNLTMFGAEYSPFGYQSNYIRKFNGTVRFYVHNLSRKNRKREVTRFIRSLNGSIRGLKAEVTNRPERANFHVYVVDRKDYTATVRQKVYRRPTANTPGKCLVRSVFSRAGIRRSDAVIVSDEGESLFKRCKAEEILQGLGPLNEHVSLRESMFNDRTKHTNFTRFDKLILNMLYDKRIANGAVRESVQGLLPDVLRDAKRRVR
ncbi:MAG: DUF2927 domain-containing protein [Rhizobiaceae bacterium]